MELTRQMLYEMIWREPLSVVASRLSVSANGLGKLCARLDIPRPAASHWTISSNKREPRPPLPPTQAGASEFIRVHSRRTARPRTRLTVESRRDQLLQAAGQIAIDNGLTDLTIKTVAQVAGISEAQVHNYFGGRLDLLIALARREISSISKRRSMLLARGNDRRTRIVISTLSYLHEAAEHGPLLQRLLREPDVRAALKREWEARSSQAMEPIVKSLTDAGGLDQQSALASTAALTAISMRAGGIVAARRAPFETVERLCVAMMMAGIESDARAMERDRAVQA